SKALDLSLQGGWASYPAADNIDLTQGTVSFWLRPTWGPDRRAFHMIFRVLFDEENRGSQSKGTRNWKHELLFISRTEGNPVLRVAQVEAGVRADISSWSANTWHHVVATWDKTSK